MPAEPAPAPPAPGPHATILAELEHAVARLRHQLDALADRRRRDGALIEHWQGGHRERFEHARSDVERLARRLDDTLARLALVSRRALDETAR